VKRWQDGVIAAGTPIIDAIEAMNRAGTGICLVCDGEVDGRLVGTVTDGDIRRGLLARIALDQPIERVMNPRPQSLPADSPPAARLAVMRQAKIHQLPLIEGGRVVGLALLDDLLDLDASRRDNWVVLMAGGQGKRLRPLTETLPKPLIRVGNRPVMETILDNLIGHGFRRFFISVNYKAEMIERHFGDGHRWNVEIRYLRETTPLGTAGPLGLIHDPIEAPLVVMNGDVLTRVDFSELLDHHARDQAIATMGVRKYEFQLPFGVVRIGEDGAIRDIEEKPRHDVFVNAGIYVLNPPVLGLLSPGTALDMPALFDRLIARGERASVFPIHEYWMDIGRIDDLEQANREFDRVFPR